MKRGGGAASKSSSGKPGTPAGDDFVRRFLKMKHCVFLTIVIIIVSATHAADWPHWRGPNFNGSTDEKSLPVKWSQTENVAWSVDLPGPSAATPIVSADRVFISSVDSAADSLLAMCFDRTNGKLLWRHENAKGTRRDKRSNYAAPSPVTDGKVVIFFYSTGLLIGYGMDGNRIWSRSIRDDYGPFAFLWTFSSSPTLYRGKLYLQVLQRDVPVSGRGLSGQKNRSYILVMDPKTGKTLWRQFRPTKAYAESHEAFSTPIPATLDGKDQLLVVGGDILTGHDLQTGKELWRWGTWNPDHAGGKRLVPSPVAGEGIVLACAPKNAPIYAIRPNSAGLLDDTAIAWTTADTKQITADVPTPAFYDGDFFILSDLRKTLSRVDPQTGKIKWTIPTPGKAKYEASPLAADGKIYIINHDGQTDIINAANGKLINSIQMDNPTGRAVVRASITAANAQLFIRTTKKLFCLGK
ncbi:MAG: PQQ-binding-like beta-propeller repeat protein [Planctomycetes bacterium]|nr:PQQ-binding-like beta-propeller repeat protein [Planctomycetota bacterium]